MSKHTVLTDGKGSDLIQVVGIGVYVPLEKYQRLEAQNAELVAQVALLCEKLKDIEDTESDKPYVYRLQAKQALRLANDSPAQHLCDRDAEAGRAGWLACWNWISSNEEINFVEANFDDFANQYAERVRAGE